MVGLASTMGAAAALNQSVIHDRSARFDASAERARSAVSGRLQLHLEELAQLRNWILVQPVVTREQFHAITALGFDQGLYPGVQAVSFAPRVPRRDLARFEASTQAETAALGTYPPFAVHPSTTGVDAYIVSYLEPMTGNEPAFGFDLSSDPPRLEAIEAARDRGATVGSAPIRLVQEPGHQAGFLLLAPLYDTHDVPTTAPARRRHFAGTVDVAFRVGDMFAGALGAHPEVDAEMYDLGPTIDEPAARFDRSTRLLDTNPRVVVDANGQVRGMHRDIDLNIGDRRWRMVLTPASGFADTPRGLMWLVACFGAIVTALLASVVHVTSRARGRAERLAMAMTAEVRTAEARTSSIIQGAPDAMLVMDGRGRIASVNLATESVFGYTAHELKGQPIELLLPDDLAEAHRLHRATYLQAPRRREMGAELELLGRRRDGTTFALEVSLSPLVGHDGAVEVIAAVRDVSERRGAQAALQDAYDHERETADQLRQANELKATFLNTISHELRTPLTAIAGFTDLLLTVDLPPQLREDYLRRVRRNAHSLSTLILEVLAFASMDSQEMRLEPVDLDVGDESRLVVDQLAPVLGDHIVVIDSPEPVIALADRGAFTRILTNLLTNAARYAPAGTTVTISIEQREGRALFAVSDEGPGIPADEQSRVFDRFFRGATALASRVPGTGVGLAVVSELTHRSGGAVRVTSGEDGGARFEVELPAGSTG